MGPFRLLCDGTSHRYDLAFMTVFLTESYRAPCAHGIPFEIAETEKTDCDRHFFLVPCALLANSGSKPPALVGLTFGRSTVHCDEI